MTNIKPYLTNGINIREDILFLYDNEIHVQWNKDLVQIEILWKKTIIITLNVILYHGYKCNLINNDNSSI